MGYFPNEKGILIGIRVARALATIASIFAFSPNFSINKPFSS